MPVNFHIVAATNTSMGHAGVARALAREIRKARPDVRTYLDEAAMARHIGFGEPFRELYELGPTLHSEMENHHVVLLDTIPLRRQELVLKLVESLRCAKNLTTLCGHTGWLEGLFEADVRWWRELLQFMRVRAIVLYHGIDVCGGHCDIGKASACLGVPVFHIGLLLPPVSLRSPHPDRRIAVSMGGGVAADEAAYLAEMVARKNREWDVDLFVGPYASAPRDLSPIVNIRTFHEDFASELTTYRASIARGGYGSCVDHIAAQTPALLLPLHIEQQSNVTWAKPYLGGQVLVDANYGLSVRSSPDICARPRAFSSMDLIELLGRLV